MTARERLHAMIRTDDGDRTVWSEDEATTALDAYRTEVLTAGAALLRRQSRHHLNRPHFNAGLRQGAVLLDRLTNRTQAAADSVNDGDFFEPGRTYAADSTPYRFHCVANVPWPDGSVRALGRGAWTDSTELHWLASEFAADDWTGGAWGGWTDITEEAL